jgi:hypothetical protein
MDSRPSGRREIEGARTTSHDAERQTRDGLPRAERGQAMGLPVIPTATETLRYALGDLGWIEDDARAAGLVPMGSLVGHAKGRIEQVIQLLESAFPRGESQPARTRHVGGIPAGSREATLTRLGASPR